MTRPGRASRMGQDREGTEDEDLIVQNHYIASKYELRKSVMT
jgi:hypothetical protein